MKHCVIIMSYNRPRFVRDAIASVLTQEGDVQLIVADDGSSDATLSVVRSCLDERATLLELNEAPPERRSNGGPRSCARINFALGNLPAGTEVVHVLPDDDVFMPGRFVAFDDAFARRPDASWFYGRIIPVDAKLARMPDSKFSFDPFPGAPIYEPDCRIDCTQVGHRVSCLSRVPGYPLSHEGHFFTKLAQHFGPALPLFTDAPVSAHRYHDFNLLTHLDRAGDLPRE